MRIEKLHLSNFRCYDELEIDFEPKLTVIVGENGKGKTAIFDALALGLSPYLQAFGLPEKNIRQQDARQVPVYAADGKHIESMHTQYPVTIAMEGVVRDQKVSCKRQLLADSTYKDEVDLLTESGKNLLEHVKQHEETVLPAFAYYGTSRIWVDSSLMANPVVDLEDRRIGYVECLEPSSSYSTFGRWFMQLMQKIEQAETDSKTREASKTIEKAVLKAVDTCLESIGLRDLYYNQKLGTMVVTHPDMGEMIVEDLSDGFRAILSMVADLAYRMVRLNPQFGEQAVLKTPGIVLVDEVDMHLHPLWSQTVLVDLQRAFPLVQFIVTTHSPQVISSVAPECIRVLEWDRQFRGVRHVDFSLGAKTSQILEDIQNVDERAPQLPIVKDLQRYLELVSEDAWDSEEAKSLRKELDAWAKGNEPALVRADMDIRMRQFRRNRS